ncbi:MAG: S8 family serine peptidase, partial [Roseiflexaceae bacterium]
MSRRISILLTLLGVMLIAALLPAASFADPANPPAQPISYSSTGLQPPTGLANANGRLTVMIELAAPAAIAAPSGPNSQSARQQLAAAQAALMPQLASFSARVMFKTSLVYAGVAVTIPADQLDRLRALPGVARVTVIPPKLPSDLIPSTRAGAQPLVAAIAAATGQGLRIGMIDRGIDYTHADCGGPGTPLAYIVNDPSIIEPGSFPSAKVDGFDFAGDTYDASARLGSDTPTPDPDPRECMQPDAHAGRGTSAAGLAAGFGVAADGTPYHGPYGPGVDLSTLRVAPGVAPEAQLYALKVLGCHGSTTLLTQAIERAIDPNGDGSPADHLDVLVISLGTPFGSDEDPDAIAVNNAVRAGMVVVVAAGDNLETFYSVDSPASASLAIAVGATDASGAIAAFSARGPQRGNHALKVDLVAPGVNLRSAAAGSGSDASVSSGTAIAAAQVGGAAALLRQLHSGWTPAQIKAALIDTATPLNAPPSLVGGGQLNIAGLGDLSLLAYSADGGGLTYGAPWVSAAWAATRTLQLENTGDITRSVTLAATATTTETGVTLQPPTEQIIIPAHGVAQATITMTIDPSGLEFSPDATTAPKQDIFARHYLAEHGGSITISSVGGEGGVRVRPAHAAHFGSADFYLDDQLLDDSLDSREVDEYVNTTPGAHVVKLRRPGAAPNSAPLFSAPVNLLDGHDYTLIMVGRPGELGLVTADETAPAPPPAGQSLIHFVNANRVGVNWDIGPLDVYLDGALYVPALAVGATSAYFPLAPGTHEVLFFHAGADPTLARRVAHKTFVAGTGQAILLGTGRHDDDDGRIDDDEQRAFIGYGDVRLVVTLVERVPFNVFPIVASDARADTALNVVSSARAFALGLHNTGARNSGLNGAQATSRTPLASAFELEATSPP